MNIFLFKRKLKLLREKIWVDFVVILLSIFSAFLLVYELTADLVIEHVVFIHNIDLIIAMLFLTDFIIRMYVSEHKLKYFRSNWTDLLASIPITEGVYRSFRILRILRLVRIIRLFVRIKRLGAFSESLLKHSAKYIYISTGTIAVVLSSAVIFFSLEFGKNESVQNFFDALWWSVVTATTVGYGDIYPVTMQGRILGIFLMFFGIGLVSVMAGFVASYFIHLQNKKEINDDE